MVQNKLCTGTLSVQAKASMDQSVERLGLLGHDAVRRPTNIKRLRLKCPDCGRKVISSAEIPHDGAYIVHTIPPHKKKMWWKKNEKRSRE